MTPKKDSASQYRQWNATGLSSWDISIDPDIEREDFCRSNDRFDNYGGHGWWVVLVVNESLATKQAHEP